jgi:hypothetical protein
MKLKLKMSPRKRIVCPKNLIELLSDARTKDEREEAKGKIEYWVNSNINELALGDEFVLPHPVTLEMITYVKHSEGAMIQ